MSKLDEKKSPRKFVMMMWDCPTCGYTGNPGPNVKCEGCAKSRPSNVKNYVPNNAPTVTNPKEIAAAQAGPDWYCGHCHIANKAGASVCTQCGGPQGLLQDVKPRQYGPGKMPRSSADVKALDQAEYDQQLQAANTPSTIYEAAPSAGFNIGSILRKAGLGIGAVVVLILVFLGAQAALKRHAELSIGYDYNAKIVGFSWQRVLYVDEYRATTSSGWSVPAGAKVLKTEKKVKESIQVVIGEKDVTNRVADGVEEYDCDNYEDLGNGYAENVPCTRTKYKDVPGKEPVYGSKDVEEDWYTYETYSWVYSRPITTGEKTRDIAPYWGSVTLKCENEARVGCERLQANKDEVYNVYLEYRDATEKVLPYSKSVPENIWNTLNTNKTYTLNINGYNQLLNNPFGE